MEAGTKTLIALGIGVMLVSYLSTLSHFWGQAAGAGQR